MMGRWAKGQSGNAKGRASEGSKLGRLIRSQTMQGEELVTFALRVMRGEETTRALDANGVPVDLAPSLRERVETLKWLADRGWGKAVETVVVEDEANGPRADSVAAEALEDGLGPEGCVQ